MQTLTAWETASLGEFRDYRNILPGAVFILFSFLPTLIIAPSLLISNSNVDGKTLAYLIAGVLSLLISNFAAGYVFNVFVTFRMGPMFLRDCRGVEGLPADFLSRYKREANEVASSVQGTGFLYFLTRDMCQTESKKLSDSYRLNDLTAEISIRFHSHAPEELVNWQARRLTAVYVAYGSGIAAVLGTLVGAVVLTTQLEIYVPILSGCALAIGIVKAVSIAIFLLSFAAACFENARCATREHWDVICKFLTWDLETHPL